jgi:hypothetical protein
MQQNIDSSNVNIASLTSSIDPKSSKRGSTSKINQWSIFATSEVYILVEQKNHGFFVIFTNRNLGYKHDQKNCDALQTLVMKVQHENKDIVGPFILKFTHKKMNGFKTFVVFATMCTYKISSLNQSPHIAKVVGLMCNNYIFLAT